MAQRFPWRRRLLLLVGVLLLVAVAAVLLFPRYARPALEHALSGALGIPVAIGALEWQPRENRLTLDEVALGAPDTRTTLRRLVVDASPRALWSGDIVIDRIAVEAPTGALELDADYRPRLPGFGGDALTDRAVPPVTIRDLVVTDGDLTIRYPVQGELRAAHLRLARLDAADLSDTAGGVPMRANLTGTLDGAPFAASGRAQLGTDGGVAIAATGQITDLEINRRTIDLLPALQTFHAMVDVQASYDSGRAPAAPLHLDVTLREPRITDDAGTEFAAQRVELPEVRIDPADGTIAIDRIAVDHPVGIVQLDAQYRPTLGRFGSESHADDAAPLELRLREVVLTDGALSIRYPVGGEQRIAPLHLARLVCTDVVLAGDRVAMQAQLNGTFDGAALEGTARLQLGGAAPTAVGELRATGLVIDRTRLDLPPGFDGARATVDLTAAYESRGAPPLAVLRLDARLRQPRLGGRDGAAFAAAAVALPSARLDFLARHLALGPISLDAPAVDVAITDRGVLLPPPFDGAVPDRGKVPPPPNGAPRDGDRPPPSVAAAWTIDSGPIDARKGRLRLRRGDTQVNLTAVSGRWGGLVPGTSQPLTLQAALGGGSVSATGTLGFEPPEAQVDIEAKALPLPPLVALTRALPLRLTRGSGDATLSVTQRDGMLRVHGRGRLRDTHTAPPDAARPAEVMAVHVAEAEFSVESGERTAIDVASLTLSYPYVLVQRHAGGTFPYDLIDGGGAAQEPPALRLRRVAVDGGKVEFLDATLAPPYWTSLSGLRGEVVDVGPPDVDESRFTLTGKQDEISAIELAGRLTPDGVDGRITLRDAPLRAMNPYVGPLLGYDVTAGWLSLDVDAQPEPPGYAATARLVLRGVDVLQTGVDVIQTQSGVPLPIALGLIADHAGTIDMTLPLSIDVSARQVTLGSVLGQAVRSAIVGALTSPLRILGSLFGTRGAPHAFAIDPIPFPVGVSALDASGTARVAQIARILQAHTGLVLVATPQLTAPDLAAVGADGAPALAAARLAAVRAAFTGADADPRLALARLTLVEWRPASDTPPADPSGVYVELQDQP